MGSLYIPATSNVILAELQAMFEGFSRAVDCGFRKIIIESNALSTINLLNSGEEILSEHIAQDILSLSFG